LRRRGSVEPGPFIHRLVIISAGAEGQ
jgi:hypothetical protein